ncbi:MAG: MFS transporter [Acidimicrobiales bacterium]
MDAAAIYARRWWTLGVLCMSLLVIGIDNTILNVALPTLTRELHATTTQLQWIVDGYTLVFAGLLLTAGSLGDRFGRRGALTLGLVIFGTGSLLSALAASPGQLIATRCLMGIGGAFIMPATLSILTNVFTVPAERARAIAVWAGFSAMGIAFGPISGGYLLEHFSWSSVFVVNLPIVVVALIGGRLFIPTSKDPSAPRLDPIGAGLSIAGLTSLLYGIIEAPSYGWTDAKTLAAFAVAVVLLGAFVAWEAHIDHPMLDVHFFDNPRFTAASLAVTLTFFALFGALFLLTQYLQIVLGYSALEAGAALIPIAAVLMVCAPLSAKLVEGVGTKVIVAGGLVGVAAGLAVMSTLGASSGYGPVLLSLVVLGAGMGFTMAPATESIMGSLPLGKAGVGSAVNDTTRQVGGALGVAILGSLVSSSYGTRVVEAFRAGGVRGPAVTAARDSIGAAVGVAQGVGGAPGRALATAARVAYVDAMGPAVMVAAAAALLGAVIAAVFLPARAPEPPAPAPAAAADEDELGDMTGQRGGDDDLPALERTGA